MTRKTRQAIFWIFFLIFVVIGPAMILYARGYRFDFVKRKFVATGALFVKSEPPGAVIYVNGVKKGETSGTFKDALTKSSLISNILPGEYDVRVEKAGYIPWVKKLQVRVRQVTEARSIFLLPAENVPEALYFNTTKDARISPDGRQAAIVSAGSVTTWITLVNTETKEQKSLYAEKRSAPGKSPVKKTAGVGDILASPLYIQGFSKNGRLLVVRRNRGNLPPDFFVIDQEKPNAMAAQISPGPTNILRTIFLDNDRILLSGKGNAVHEWRFFEEPGRITQILSATGWGITERNTRLYSLAGSPPMLYAFGLDGKDRQQLTTAPVMAKPEPVSLEVLELPEGNFALLVIPENAQEGNVLRVNADGSLYALQDRVRGMEISPDGKKLLLRTWNELSALYLDDVLVQPERRRGDKVLIARFGVGIKDAKWLTSDYVFYTIPEGLFVIELDDRGNIRNNHDLIRNGDVTLKTITGDAVYFTAQDRLQRFSLKPDPKE